MQKVSRMAGTSRLAVVVLVSFHLIVAASANSLQILPSEDVQKPIGSKVILTCKPKVEDPKLITDMQWLDPPGRVIESLKLAVIPIESAFAGNSKPVMYTEMQQDGSLSLFFNSIQEEQAGTYTCKANYANAVALNKTATIETIVAITWEDAPLNQNPILGEDFSIRCKVRARPSPSVNWLHNGEVIKTNDHYIIETHALKIKNVQESDDGVYTCRASVLTTGELEERFIRVEVHTRPKIEEANSQIEITEGETRTIVCKASGKPPPKFSWVQSISQKNLSTADRFSVDADTGVLTITNVKREDAGEYQCHATNAAGTATSVVQMNVIVKPKIMEFMNKSAPVGSKDLSIVCKAFGKPPPQVVFRKHTSDKTYIVGTQPNDDRIVLKNEQNEITSETVATLTFDNLSRQDDGLYECIAKNKGGVVYKNGHITVEFPPDFSSMPNKTVWSWDQRPVNLTCIAESIPNATIRWTVYGDQSIENDPMIKQIGQGAISTLNITPMDKRYYTNYRCIATNPHGQKEILIELRQATRPGHLEQVKMIEITATTIKFDIVPPLDTPPEMPVRTITVQYKEELQTWTQAKNKTWSINSLYVIEGLKPQTTYHYRFSARNEVGASNWGNDHTETTPGKTHPNEPKIITKPGTEYDVSPFSNQYELSWLVPAENGEPIDFYDIKYCQIKRVKNEWKVEVDTCQTTFEKGRTRHWLKELKADTFYQVDIKAHNVLGYSREGSAKFKTKTGLDPSVINHQAPLISSAAIIGIVIAILFIILLVIDVICCCAHKQGIIFYVCERSRRKPVDEEDSKLGRDEKEPLKEEKKITPIIDSGLRRETSITFDGKRSISKTGFVGKDSAV